jgi:hypothetical protein
MMFFVLSAIFMAVTAFLHTYFGEKRLLGPLFASQTPFFEPHPRRRMLRTSWHYQSIFMRLQSLIRSRGKHVGVIPLLGAGVTAIAGAVL